MGKIFILDYFNFLRRFLTFYLRIISTNALHQQRAPLYLEVCSVLQMKSAFSWTNKLWSTLTEGPDTFSSYEMTIRHRRYQTLQTHISFQITFCLQQPMELGG